MRVLEIVCCAGVLDLPIPDEPHPLEEGTWMEVASPTLGRITFQVLLGHAGEIRVEADGPPSPSARWTVYGRRSP